MQQPALVLPWLESLQQSLEPYPMAWPATVLAALVAVVFGLTHGRGADAAIGVSLWCAVMLALAGIVTSVLRHRPER